MKKVRENENGITLVALVITVIIMLILAGVIISMLTSDGGLFEKTQGAADKYSQAAQNEADQMASLMNDIDKYLNGLLTGETDKTAPTVATIEVSDITETTFTLTATGEDETGISKYEFYINGVLENTVTTTEKTAIYNVTEKTGNTAYTCKVRVFNEAGNYKDSSEISVKTKIPSMPAATTVNVGDYVNYDAGTWTAEDFTKITSSAGSPTVNKSVSLPTTQGQFGGFIQGQSRNTNSTENDVSWKPRTAGWRVWSIEGNIVTLISAGHPETYYHARGYSSASINILKNRNCSMYENSYAQSGSAHILTGQKAVAWYNKQFGTNYTIVENGGSNSTFYNKTFTTEEPISVLENGSNYWLASASNTNNLYRVAPGARYVGSNLDRGYRSAYPSFSKV